MAIGGAITSATAGSVLFAGVGGILQQDNANLFWDDTNNRLGIGTATPLSTLHVAGTSRFVGSSFTNYLTAAGRLLLNTATESTYILDVNGTARVSGSTIVGNLDATSSATSEIGANTRFLAVNTNNIYFIGSPTGYFINSTNIVLGGNTGLTIRTHTNANVFLAPSGGSVSVGTSSINASAIFQTDSTTKGFLPPRMTTTQKNAIGTPAAGLMVFDTTLVKLCVYNGSAWETITSL